MATICCCGCTMVETKTTLAEEAKIKFYRLDIANAIYSIKIEEHLYIISGKGGIIHAEHCPCKIK